MITSNPFADLSALIPANIMQAYVVLMFLLVIAGTVLDMIHKKSAQYFFENAKKAEKEAKRQVTGGEKASIAVATLTNEVLTSSEFQNPRRRVSHLFTMYGFIIFVVSTAWLIFGYTEGGEQAPGWLAAAWHLGAAALYRGRTARAGPPTARNIDIRHRHDNGGRQLRASQESDGGGSNVL
jgi:hypothetical protein